MTAITSDHRRSRLLAPLRGSTARRGRACSVRPLARLRRSAQDDTVGGSSLDSFFSCPSKLVADNGDICSYLKLTKTEIN